MWAGIVVLMFVYILVQTIQKGGERRMANQVNKSHKGRQKMANERRGKYKRQLRRSIAKKIKVLEAYLLQHPKDKQNQRDISIAIKKYNVMF